MMDLPADTAGAPVNDSNDSSSPPDRHYVQQRYDEAINRGNSEGWNNRMVDHGYWQSGTEPEETTNVYQPNWERADAAAPHHATYDPVQEPAEDQHSNPPWSGYHRYDPSYQYSFHPPADQGYNQGWYYPQAANANWAASAYYPQYPHQHPAFSMPSSKDIPVSAYEVAHAHAASEEQQHSLSPYASSAGALSPYTSPGHPHGMSQMVRSLGSEHQHSSIESLDSEKRQRRNRTKSFPEKLMEVLTETILEEAVAWLPDGRSFVILNQDLFVSEVLNTGFKATKYASFIRKLHRWGFVRLTSGIGADCFHHPLFTKDTPGNAAYITCPTVQGKSAVGAAKKMHSKPSLPGVERFIRSKMSAIASSAQQERSDTAATGGSSSSSASHRDHQIYPRSSTAPRIKAEGTGEGLDGDSGYHHQQQQEHDGRFGADSNQQP